MSDFGPETNSSQQKRMRSPDPLCENVKNKRKKSTVHNHFVKHDAVSVRCRWCLKIYRNHNNTTNLLKHVERKHPQHIGNEDSQRSKSNLESLSEETFRSGGSADEDDPTILNPESSMAPGTDIVGTCKGRSRSLTAISGSTQRRKSLDSRGTSIDSQNPLCKQLSIDKAFDKVKAYTDGASTAAKITNAIVYMIAVDRQPFSVVEDRGFKNLLGIVAPLYTVPCRKTVTTRTDEKFELLSSKIKTLFSKLDNLSLTTDIWTDPYNTRSYLGVTVHYMNFETTKLEEISLGMKELERGHTAEYLSAALTEVLREWTISHDAVVVVTTDSASKITKAIYDTFGRSRHLPCFAHTLNLVVQDSIKATSQFQAIVKKVKTIVTFFKRSVKAADGLKEVQAADLQNGEFPLKLIQECETRWNSMFYMIERFIKLANHVNTVLISLPTKRNDNIPDMVTHSELRVLTDTTAILSLVEKVITEMSGETYVTCSKVIPIINCLIKSLEKLNTDQDVSESLRSNILKELNRRFHAEGSNVEKNSILAISTLLDPRFKKLHFRSPLAVSTAVAKICNLMKEKRNDAVSTILMETTAKNVVESRDDLWSVHDELMQASSSNSDEPGGVPVELRQFLNANVINRQEDPLKSWQRLSNVYPKVWEVAMKYFVVMGTSVPSERLFSAAGDVISAKRSRLTGKRASAVVFLGSLPQRYWE